MHVEFDSLDWALPPEIIEIHVFPFLDTVGFYNASLCCSQWKSMTDTHFFWSNMFTSLQSQLSEDAQQYLFPPSKVLSSMIKRSLVYNFTPPYEMDREKEKIKLKYRLCMTSILVSTDEVVQEEYKSILESLPDHFKIRKQRLFSSLDRACSYACHSDLVLIESCDALKDTLVMDKPLFICNIFNGGVQMEGNITIDLDPKYNYQNSHHKFYHDPKSNSEPHLIHETERFSPLQRIPMIIDSLCFSGPILRIKYSRVLFWNVAFDCNLIVEEGADLEVFLSYVSQLQVTNFDGLSLTCHMTFSGDVLDELYSNIRQIFKTSNDVHLLSTCMLTAAGITTKLKSSQPNIEQEVLDHLNCTLDRFYNNREIVQKYFLALQFLEDKCLENIAISKKIKRSIPLFMEDRSITTSVCSVIMSTSEMYASELDPELSKLVIKILEIHYKSCSKATTYALSCLWNLSFNFASCIDVFLQNFKLFEDVLERWKGKLRVVENLCGFLRNVLTNTPIAYRGLTDAILPNILCSSKELNKSSGLGIAEKTLVLCSPEGWKFFFNSDYLNWLFELLSCESDNNDTDEMAGNWTEYLWKLLGLISRQRLGQMKLSEKISVFNISISNHQKSKIARLLSLQPNVDSQLVRAVGTMTSTNDPVVFRLLMLAMVNITPNVLLDDLHEATLINQQLLSRAQRFEDKSITEWIDWFKNKLEGIPVELDPSVVRFDPSKSSGWDLTYDGLVLRHGVTRDFSTAIATHSAKTGKWYYEVTLQTAGLFQIGWCNKYFVPHPDNGAGVGDDSHSWAIDFFRGVAWHQRPTGDSAKKLNLSRKWQPGDCIQFYLDCDSRTMSFGWNGYIFHNVFTKVEVADGLFPSLSSNFENECSFNFGLKPFRFLALKGYAPFQKFFLG
eukprot:TRINITY_DN5301_c0_g2_i2.p1 TRINITY_DN5301_c0_g2~~TRINITY_DN5301_c0_g2_i2.p1  ORF type:complete len:898 (-),score=183.74 TRINITY_DN5301_c0_g2_i2:120-2813(-)